MELCFKYLINTIPILQQDISNLKWTDSQAIAIPHNLLFNICHFLLHTYDLKLLIIFTYSPQLLSFLLGIHNSLTLNSSSSSRNYVTVKMTFAKDRGEFCYFK